MPTEMSEQELVAANELSKAVGVCLERQVQRCAREDVQAPLLEAWMQHVRPLICEAERRGFQFALPAPPSERENAARGRLMLRTPGLDRHLEGDDALRDVRAYKNRDTGEVRALSARDLVKYGPAMAWEMQS
jgi:hypothetical protein